MTAPTQVLLLPGLLCDASYWQAQVQGLSAHARCVVADYGMAESLETMARVALQQADAAGMTGQLAAQRDKQQANRHGEDNPPADKFKRRHLAHQYQIERQQPPDQMRTQSHGYAAGAGRLA